jgi:hypothetical protein
MVAEFEMRMLPQSFKAQGPAGGNFAEIHMSSLDAP